MSGQYKGLNIPRESVDVGTVQWSFFTHSRKFLFFLCLAFFKLGKLEDKGMVLISRGSSLSQVVRKAHVHTLKW